MNLAVTEIPIIDTRRTVSISRDRWVRVLRYQRRNCLNWQQVLVGSVGCRTVTFCVAFFLISLRSPDRSGKSAVKFSF